MDCRAHQYNTVFHKCCNFYFKKAKLPWNLHCGSIVIWSFTLVIFLKYNDGVSTDDRMNTSQQRDLSIEIARLKINLDSTQK